MSSTPASSSMDTLPKKDKSPSTLTTLAVITVLALVWFIAVIVIGYGIAAALKWLLEN